MKFLNSIYLMQYRNGRTCKIGISHHPRKRLKAVDDDLCCGRVKLLVARRVPFARQFENWLHRRFAASRFTLKGAGSGKTEWFKLGVFSRIYAYLIIQVYYYAWRFLIAVSALLLVIGLYSVTTDRELVASVISIIENISTE